MPTSLACVDASVIVRLVTQPDNRVLQDRWEAWQRDGTQLAAPSLLFYEVSNALYRYQQSESMSREQVQAAMDAALALPVEIHPATAALHRAAVRLAAQFGLPAAYDAHYSRWLKRLTYRSGQQTAA